MTRFKGERKVQRLADDMARGVALPRKPYEESEMEAQNRRIQAKLDDPEFQAGFLRQLGTPVVAVLVNGEIEYTGAFEDAMTVTHEPELPLAEKGQT